MYSSSYKEHVALVRDLCKTANDNNVSFNKKKTAFAKKIAIFAGYEVSSNGFRRCISTKRFRLSLKTNERIRSMAHRSSRIAISPLPRDTIRHDRTRMFGRIVGHEEMPSILGRTIKFLSCDGPPPVDPHSK